MFPTFTHILCRLPDTAKAKKSYFIGALIIFMALAFFFYTPYGMDWGSYGYADWDYSYFAHAVPVWTIKYFHQFPLWNPYVRGGFSLIGNPQNPSPFSLTFFMSLLAGPIAGVKIGNILNAIAGMAGMYVLMGYFNTVWIARILAALVLAFNGTVAYHLSQGHFMWMTMMYWPWMMLFFLKGLDNRLWIYPAALMLSLQFWGASTSVLAFTAAVLLLLAVFFALRDKKIGHLLRFAELMGAFVIFSAPRLFMVMETLYRFPRVIGNEDIQIPWKVFYYAFFCRDQLHDHVQGLVVREYSAYVGLIPCILTVVLFFQWKKFWPYLCLLLFALVMAFGNAPYSPFWPVFHAIGGGYFHFSTRSFLIAVFFIALSSGLALSYVLECWQTKYPAIVLIALAALVFVMVDFVLVLSPLRQLSVANARQYEGFQSNIPFSQLDVSLKQEFRYSNSFMMDLLLRNTGTSNGYEALPVPSFVHARNAPGYRGEFYLQGGAGNIAVASWSPNRWDVKLNLLSRDVLMVNQNFDPGWKTEPPRKVLNVNGLLGVELTPDDPEIVFYYCPFNFILGCWITFLGLLAIIWDMAIARRGSNKIRGAY